MSYDLRQKVFRILFFLLFAILTISSIQRTVKKDLDFKVFHQAGVIFFESEPDLYNPSRDGIFTYKYSPFFAILAGVFAFFRHETAKVIWAIMSSLAFIGSWYYAEKILKHLQVKITYSARLLTLLMVLQPVTNNAIQGNINVILLFLCLLGVWLSIENRNIEAGFWAALAFSIKLTPAIILLFFLLKKKYRSFLYGLLFAVIFMIIIPALVYSPESFLKLNLQWFEVLRDTRHYPMMKYTNQAPLAVFIHWFGNHRVVHLVAMLPAVTIMVMLFYFYARKSLTSLVAVVSVFVLYLVASPVAWLEYYVFLLVPLLVLNSIFTTRPVSNYTRVLYYIRVIITLVLVRAIIGREAADWVAYRGQHLVGLFLMLMIFALERKSLVSSANT